MTSETNNRENISSLNVMAASAKFSGSSVSDIGLLYLVVVGLLLGDSSLSSDFVTGLVTFALCCFLVTEFYILSPSNSSKSTTKNQIVNKMI